MNYIDRAEAVFMNTYNRIPVMFEKGEGVYLYDNAGKKYLDFASGIAVFPFGYGNEEYNSAVKAQVDKLIHTSNFFYNEPSIEAAEKLVKASALQKVFFTSSGTEAIEGAIKLARKYAFQRDGVADHEIIAMKQSFHGRSTGALAVTGQPQYQTAFGPLISGVRFAEFNDLQSVEELITDKTCAIILETIQGEGGIYPATNEFLRGIRRLCDEKDIVMILDEIQCGMGRTGTMFAYEQYGVLPDIMTTAKALGAGLPVGAFVANDKIASAFRPGDHGTTYGFNPLVTAAVSKVFDMFQEMKLTDHVQIISEYMTAKLQELVSECDQMKELRGRGLLLGIECYVPVAPIISKCLENGLVVISAGANVLRFVPPLVVTKEQVDMMMDILIHSLKTQ